MNSSRQCIYGTRGWPRTYIFQQTSAGIEDIWAWGAPPSDDDTFFFDMLEVRTDGSAVLRKGWPVVPISAGWGALFVVVKPDRSWRFLGALWGPVDVNESSQYFLGATRPTIPIAELTASTVVLMLLRQMQFQGSVAWGTDSLYALGIMTLGYGAATECKFVNRAHKEARVAKASWNLKGFHTPSHTTEGMCRCSCSFGPPQSTAQSVSCKVNREQCPAKPNMYSPSYIQSC